MGINALKNVLKEHTMQLKADEMMWNTNVPVRKEDIDNNKIKPQHCPEIEWMDTFHLEWEPVRQE